MNDYKICNEIYRKIDKSWDLLDVGCGDGYMVNCLARKLNRKVVGFDMSDSGFAKSHKWCRKLDTCDLIECVKGDAHVIDECFDGKIFDAVTLIYTLHHIDRPSL